MLPPGLFDTDPVDMGGLVHDMQEDDDSDAHQFGCNWCLLALYVTCIVALAAGVIWSLS